MSHQKLRRRRDQEPYNKQAFNALGDTLKWKITFIRFMSCQEFSYDDGKVLFYSSHWGHHYHQLNFIFVSHCANSDGYMARLQLRLDETFDIFLHHTKDITLVLNLFEWRDNEIQGAFYLYLSYMVQWRHINIMAPQFIGNSTVCSIISSSVHQRNMKFCSFAMPLVLKMVSCKKGPTRHAYTWLIGPFWQDTLEAKALPCLI